MSELTREKVEIMSKMGRAPLPSVDEILSGDTQGGVPRPAFLKSHEDDGTVERVSR